MLSMPSLQFVTTQSRPKALARSLVDSVFPVPAGPAGAPPRYMERACITITQPHSGILSSKQADRTMTCAAWEADLHFQNLTDLRDSEVDAVRQWSDNQSTVQAHVLVAVRERSTALPHKEVVVLLQPVEFQLAFPLKLLCVHYTGKTVTFLSI